jgi:hypothetical protein
VENQSVAVKDLADYALSGFKMTDSENCLAILILFCNSTRLACVAKIDLENAKLVIFEVHDLNVRAKFTQEFD